MFQNCFCLTQILRSVWQSENYKLTLIMLSRHYETLELQIKCGVATFSSLLPITKSV